MLVALTAFLLLELLVFGIGPVSTADRPGNYGDEDWVSGVIGLIAFFIGGYVATKASAAQEGDKPNKREYATLDQKCVTKY